MPNTKSLRYIYVDDTGGIYDINNTFISNVDKYIVKRATGDTGTLSGDVTINSSVNVQDGVYYDIEFEDAFVLGANNFNVFGEALTAAQILSKPTVEVRDNGTSYEVYLVPNALNVTTGTANIEDEAVTLAKMADLARGSLIIGNSSTRPSALDAKTSGQILVGDGSDLVSVAVSGDATLASTGALTIANDAVNNNKLANIARGSIKVGGTSNAPTDLDAKTNGYILVGDGTDINSVAVSGDVTINSSGAVTIATDAVTNTKLANMTEGTVKVGGASNAPTDLDNSTAGAIIIGNGTGVTSQVITGAITLSTLGVTTIVDDVVTTAKILNSNVTVAKVSDNLKYETLTVEVSFETGEQGNTKIKLPFGGTLVEAYGFATKAISGADNGTIVLKNHAGSTMTDGTITAIASDARATEYTITPSANNVFSIEQYLTITTAKSTVGGKILLQLKFLKA